MLEELQQEAPVHRIESLGNINLDECTGNLCTVQEPSRQLNRPIILMNLPGLDESTLIVPDKLLHQWSQATCQDLGEKFGEAMNQTDGSVIANTRRLKLLA